MRLYVPAIPSNGCSCLYFSEPTSIITCGTEKDADGIARDIGGEV